MERDGLTLPDVIVGGAPRSGTTWLYRLLDRHPDVWMAKPAVPEPKFFLVDDVYDQGLGHYASTWFADAPPGRVLGEKSSNYLENAHVARRIRHDLPDVRLVFALREPADRALSNYYWSRMNGMEDLDFTAALEAEPAREATCPPRLRYARPHAYFSRGLYADMLRPWFDAFPRDQVLVVTFEDIVARPRNVAHCVHTFLELTPRPDDGAELSRVNPSDKGDHDDHRIDFERLRHAYRQPNRDLQDLLGCPEPLWEDH